MTTSLLMGDPKDDSQEPARIQAIRRRKGISQCYVNLPLPLAAAIDIKPGEMVQ